jgi:hypothetical protein
MAEWLVHEPIGAVQIRERRRRVADKLSRRTETVELRARAA